MDAFSVSISYGLINHSFKPKNAIKLGLSFGSFQTIMPILGWFAGTNIIEFISGFDHWIAFVLLSFIGSKMIFESTQPTSKKLLNSLNLSVLMLLSVATSIDALAVGLSLSFLRVSVTTPAIVTGLVTFTLSVMGVYFGNRFGHLLGNKVEMIGGSILIIIGLRILLEHLSIF